MAVLDQIKKTFEISHKKEWYETYWAFDFHGTIFKPTYDLNDDSIHYYEFAKETLQLLTKRNDIIMITWTSSYPHEIMKYVQLMARDRIQWDHVNENPGISSNMGNFGYYETKFYFNVMFEDKAGFVPREWEEIYEYLVECEEKGYLPDPNWTKKY